MNMNMNIILLPSTTAAPATFIPWPTTCKATQSRAAGKRQRVTEAKGVALLCRVSSAVSKRR